MPLFSSSQFDQAVAKATSELNTVEDWETIMDICDKVQVTPNGPKDCLRSIVKRLNSNVPHHTLQSLTLLDACIKNCGKKFHLQVCSHDFEIEIKKLLNKKSHPKVVEKLKMYLQFWAEDFKHDSELSLIPSLYNSIKSDKAEVHSTEVQHREKTGNNSTKKEEEDLAKAIELSLKDAGSSDNKTSSLYPIASVSDSVPTLTEKREEPRKLRALYDFTAAEDNELTFKAGEIIVLLDGSDRNWWKGYKKSGGEGLFPSNFVTADLNTKNKKVQFAEEVKVKTLKEKKISPFSTHADGDQVVIDEAKIDQILHLLHEADPTGDQPDSEHLLALQEDCFAMIPLIEKQLDEIDHRHASLTAANNCLVESLNSYQLLMGYAPYPTPDMHGYHSPPQQHGFGVNTYLPAENYQPMPVPISSEHYQVPVAGALPSLQARMMQSGHSHIPYGTTNQNSIPQSSVAPNGGTFVSLSSREANGIYYGDVANSMQHNTPSISMQHQPML